MAALLCWPAAAGAAALDYDGGLEFTRVPVSVRQQGGGSTYGTYDVFKAFSNPALIGYQGRAWEVGITNQLQFGGAQNLWAAGAGYASPQGAYGAWGTAALASGYAMPAFQEVDPAGNSVGAVSPGGTQVGLAASYQFKFLSVGAGLRQASETLGTKQAIQINRTLLDAGAGFSWRYAECGAAVRGITSGVVSPRTMELGASVRFANLAFAIENVSPVMGSAAHQGNPDNGATSFGVTGTFWPFLDVRASLYDPQGINTPGGEGMLVRPGFTVRYKDWALDYVAAVPLRQGPGMTNMLGLNWAFGAPREALVVAAPSFKSMFSFGTKGQPLAVSQFDPQNVSAGDAAVISDMFRSEVIRQGAFDVVEKTNMDKILSEQAFQQTGCTSQECAVKLGKLLNVKYMVVGSFGKLLDQYVLSFRVVDIETGKAVYSDDERGLSTQKEVGTAITRLVERLTAAVAKPQN